MKVARLLFLGAGLTGLLLWLPVTAQTLDPAFAPPAMYAPAAVYSTTEQADGQLLVAGTFTRINGNASPAGLARFSPTGTLDAPFQQNLGSTANVFRSYQLSNGQLLLLAFPTISQVPLTAGGLTRTGLLRLNANGTADAGFNIGTGPAYTGADAGYLDDVLQLPSGQLLAVGLFDHFSGAVAGGIARLNADGTLDQSFAQGTGADNEIVTVLPLPGGKFLLGGFFGSYDGHVSIALVRLHANGSYDPTFVSPFDSNSDVQSLTLQPDGRILAGGYFGSASPALNGKSLVRLLPDGAVDNSFAAPASFTTATGPVDGFFGQRVQLQPDGKILVATGVNSVNAGAVTRLNADGSPDATYQVGAGPNNGPHTLNLLRNGKLLVSGMFSSFSGVKDRALVQLGAGGALDASFQPLLQNAATVNALVRQADGKLVVGGTFSEINGQPVRRLARFNPDGTLDAGFSTSTGGLDWNVSDIAAQPDGRLAVASAFELLRFQPGGQPDPSLSTAATGMLQPRQVAAQPDGKLLVSGTFRAPGSSSASALTVKRFNADGTLDNSFAITGFTTQLTQAIKLQPDGKLLWLGSFALPGSTRAVLRFNADGSRDTGFTTTALTSTTTAPAFPFPYALALQPDGKILVGGTFGAAGGVARVGVARLNASGTLDTGFVPASLSGTVYSLSVQPNNRILVGGSFTSAAGLPSNLARLNADGSADASFAATAVPNAAVRALLVQPDGGIVAGGSFTTLGGQTSRALARLAAPNVLHATLPQAVADRTTAWPVPAHTTLRVALDASAQPQTLDLLDVLGRPVRHQELRGASTATVAVDALPAGSYLLRVNYAAGSVVRRVQVQ